MVKLVGSTGHHCGLALRAAGWAISAVPCRSSGSALTWSKWWPGPPPPAVLIPSRGLASFDLAPSFSSLSSMAGHRAQVPSCPASAFSCVRNVAPLKLRRGELHCSVFLPSSVASFSFVPVFFAGIRHLAVGRTSLGATAWILNVLHSKELERPLHADLHHGENCPDRFLLFHFSLLLSRVALFLPCYPWSQANPAVYSRLILSLAYTRISKRRARRGRLPCFPCLPRRTKLFAGEFCQACMSLNQGRKKLVSHAMLVGTSPSQFFKNHKANKIQLKKI